MAQVSSTQPVRPALHVRAVLPEQVFSPGAHTGAAHVALVLAAQSSEVAHVGPAIDSPNAVHDERTAPAHEYVPGAHSVQRARDALHVAALGHVTTAAMELPSEAQRLRTAPAHE
jgi:hypothetical protein